MSAFTWDRAYDSYSSFYRDVYGQHITRSMETKTGVVLEAAQSAGDWSDAPTPDLSFAWVVKAKARMSCDLGSGRFQDVLRPGDVALTPPSSGSSLQVADPHLVRLFAVPYSSLLSLAGPDQIPSDGNFGLAHASLLRVPILTQLLNQLWEEVAASQPHGALFENGLILQIVAVLLGGRNQIPATAFRGGLAPWQVKRVTEFMEDRLADDVSLEDLSKLLDLSTFHLCRAFKQSTGLPPHRWRHQRRIERARELLESTDLPVTDVAAQVGYDDPSQLAAAFRKALGVSPSKYRRERRL